MAAQSVLKVVLKSTSKMSLNEQVTNVLEHEQRCLDAAAEQLGAETEPDPADAELTLCPGSTETEGEELKAAPG